MLRPVKPRSDGSTSLGSAGPNVILQRPELAAQIGNVAVNWHQIEHTLASLYSLLMGDYLEREPNLDPAWRSSPPSHPVAFQIFEEVQTLHTRLSFVSALCEWKCKEEQKATFGKLVARIRKVAR